MKKKVNVKGNIRRMALLVAGCVVMGGMAASQTGGNMAYAMTKEEAERQKDDTESIYVVEPGDTLVSISIKMYGTQDGAESIAAVNGLKIDEPIYEGQKLVIPYTD